MKSRFFFLTFVWFVIPALAFGQFYEYESPEIRLKTGMPNIFSVDSVRQISDSSDESVLNIVVTVKKGRIESVSKDGGNWIVTVRTSSKDASTYLIKDSQFKIMGEESKKVAINAIHWKDGN